MMMFILKLLRIVGYLFGFVFFAASFEIIEEGKTGSIITLAVFFLICVGLIMLTTRKINRINAARREEYERTRPKQFSLIIIMEHEEDDEDEETLMVQVNSFYSIGNISASYYTTLDVVRTFVPEFHVSAYPTFVIAEGNPFSNEMEGMLRYARLVSHHPAAITRFLQDEIFNHEQSLRSQ